MEGAARLRVSTGAEVGQRLARDSPGPLSFLSSWFFTVRFGLMMKAM